MHASWRETLTWLDGDIGARNLLWEAGDILLLIETDDSCVLLDIDTLHDVDILPGAIQDCTKI